MPATPTTTPTGPDQPAVQALAAAAMLDVWERAQAASPTGRALALLDAALPDGSTDVPALPIGARDKLLLRLRAACFGPSATCLCDCPSCGETTEFTVAIPDLLGVDAGAPGLEGRIEIAGRALTFRPVTSADLLAMESSPPADRVAALLARCAQGDDGQIQAPDAAAALSAAMAEADPAADLRFGLTCPSCEHRWSSGFDIAGYLWAEIEAAAQRLLPEIHALAIAYGWSEDAILALPPSRRQRYLALVGAR